MFTRLSLFQLTFSFLDIMGAATGTSQSVIGAESAKTQLTGFPTLKPAFNLKVPIAYLGEQSHRIFVLTNPDQR